MIKIQRRISSCISSHKNSILNHITGITMIAFKNRICLSTELNNTLDSFTTIILVALLGTDCFSFLERFKLLYKMNTFVIKSKLTRIRKSGTYSRYLQKFKKRIPSFEEQQIGNDITQQSNSTISEPPECTLMPLEFSQDSAKETVEQINFDSPEYSSEIPQDSIETSGSGGKLFIK